MGIIYIAPEEGPRCPTHGQMHYDLPCDRWECHGYDGEGCEYKVTQEEWFATFTQIGIIDSEGMKWKL
jgi:hypothetical protein